MRDAIVLSGWTWDTFNVPERVALALARAGLRVLYCENPVSFLRHSARTLTEVEKGVFALGLKFVGHRLNALPVIRPIQAKLLANQIVGNARKLGLHDPIFVYPHGNYCLTLCREFKRRGFRLIHISMDYELELQIEHARESDLTLSIPHAAYQELHAKFGEKVKLLPQFSAYEDANRATERLQNPPVLAMIPRPRLGYLGSIPGRISVPVLAEILTEHPEWHFISFGKANGLPPSNGHVLPWQSRQEASAIVDGLDVGFMPYDCSDPKNLHCVPLKLFDYFARGIPVVSTPIVYLRQFEDLVYLGTTPQELANRISEALAEPLQSPKKARRQAIARNHSIDNLSRVLVTLLDLSNGVETSDAR
jgi:hypothetical protein